MEDSGSQAEKRLALSHVCCRQPGASLWVIWRMSLLTSWRKLSLGLTKPSEIPRCKSSGSATCPSTTRLPSRSFGPTSPGILTGPTHHFLIHPRASSPFSAKMYLVSGPQSALAHVHLGRAIDGLSAPTLTETLQIEASVATSPLSGRRVAIPGWIQQTSPRCSQRGATERYCRHVLAGQVPGISLLQTLTLSFHRTPLF